MHDDLEALYARLTRLGLALPRDLAARAEALVNEVERAIAQSDIEREDAPSEVHAGEPPSPPVQP